MEKAEQYWRAIDRNDDAESFAWAQLYLADLAKSKDQMAEAVRHWQAIALEDQAWCFGQAQLNLGKHYQAQGDLAAARAHLSSIQPEWNDTAHAWAELYLKQSAQN